METLCKLNDISNILNEEGYFCLGHGTGRSRDTKEVIESIFKNGLRTKDNSLYYTTIGLDTQNIEKLSERLKNWEHCESKKIIIIRIPIEYINLIGDTTDLDGERYGAFMTSKEESGKKTNYLDPKFILGYFDAQTEEIVFNDLFEKELTIETTEKLRKQYREALEKTYSKLERMEKNTNFISEPELTQEIVASSHELEDFTFDDDDIEWDIPSTSR